MRAIVIRDTALRVSQRQAVKQRWGKSVFFLWVFFCCGCAARFFCCGCAARFFFAAGARRVFFLLRVRGAFFCFAAGARRVFFLLRVRGVFFAAGMHAACFFCCGKCDASQEPGPKCMGTQAPFQLSPSPSDSEMKCSPWLGCRRFDNGRRTLALRHGNRLTQLNKVGVLGRCHDPRARSDKTLKCTQAPVPFHPPSSDCAMPYMAGLTDSTNAVDPCSPAPAANYTSFLSNLMKLWSGDTSGSVIPDQSAYQDVERLFPALGHPSALKCPSRSSDPLQTLQCPLWLGWQSLQLQQTLA